jgi:AbrB family looped-hinge helix DNA binding protein
MRLTSKCQMTVPKEVRDEMDIGPGSNVELRRNQNGEYVLINADRRKGESRGEQLVRHIKETAAKLRAEGKINTDLTTDEIMEMTRGPFDDVNPR